MDESNYKTSVEDSILKEYGPFRNIVTSKGYYESNQPNNQIMYFFIPMPIN